MHSCIRIHQGPVTNSVSDIADVAGLHKFTASACLGRRKHRAQAEGGNCTPNTEQHSRACAGNCVNSDCLGISNVSNCMGSREVRHLDTHTHVSES